MLPTQPCKKPAAGWILAIGSFLCILLFASFRTSWTSQLPISDDILYIIYVSLLLTVPIRPVPSSILMCILCLIGIFSSSDMGMYWFHFEGVWYAAGILGARWGRGIVSISLAFILITLQTVGNILYNLEPSFSIFLSCKLESIIPFLIFWSAGSLLRYIRTIEEHQQEAENDARAKQEKIELLQILHDSIANDLVYATTRIRTAQKQISKPTDMDEIIGVIEHALLELRHKVITPMKNSIEDTTTIPSSESHDHGTPVEQLYRCSLEMSQRLHKLGFIGDIKLIGDFNDLPTADIRLLVSFICELGSNIAKYGQQGEYTFVTTSSATDDTVNILVSNSQLDPTQTTTPFLSSNSGLSSIRQKVRARRGAVSINSEDDEWTVYISLPYNRCNKSKVANHKAALSTEEPRS